MSKMKIVFMGTPDFAVPSLEALIKEFEVKAVVTQPDRPKGRGKSLAMSPVKEVALKHNIEVYQPEKIRKNQETIDKIKAIEPDFIVVVAFGQILPKEVLEIPRYGCINLHGSLLPRFRGAAPIHYSIMAGDKVSGNTTMLMDVGLDTGDMLLKNTVEITEKMTAGELYEILKETGAPLLIETLKKLYNNEVIPEKQNDDLSCYAHMLNRDMANIDWNKSAQEVHNFIRGLNPFPIAYSYYEDKMMKVLESEVLTEKSTKTPGTILKVDKKGMRISTKDGILLAKKIQFPNKKAMKVSEYIKGNSIEENIVLHK